MLFLGFLNALHCMPDLLWKRMKEIVLCRDDAAKRGAFRVELVFDQHGDPSQLD